MSQNLIAPEIDMPEYKLHKRGSYRVAAFFGGFLSIGLISFRNFQNLNDMNNAKKHILFFLLGAIIYLSILVIAPSELTDKIPAFIPPLLFHWVGTNTADKYFKDIYIHHEENKGQYFSGWYTFIIILVGIITNILLAMIILIITDPEIEFGAIIDLFI